MNPANTSLVVFFLVLLPAVATAQPLPVPVTIRNATAQSRSGEPVTFGFPVRQDVNLTDPAAFRVLNAAGQAVPAQFRALTRWNAPRDDSAARLRWVQATFAATVPANGAAGYTITNGGTGPAGQLSIQQQASSFVVTTAPGTDFTISRTAFTLFSSARVNGLEVLAAPGYLDLALVPTGAGVVAEQTVVEEQGPVRAVIKQAGRVGDLRYTCRWSFHGGRNDVDVQFRLENPLAYGLFSGTVPDGQRYFDRLYLVLPLGPGLTVTSSEGAQAALGTQTYRQSQSFTWPSDPTAVLNGFRFTETLNGAMIRQGGRSAGGFDVSRTDRGVSVVADRWWQNYPKSLAVESNSLRIGLWPETGNGPLYVGQYAMPGSGPPDPNALSSYRYEGGRWKTHRLVFDFHAGGPRAVTAVASLAARVNAPLAGCASGRYVTESGATGRVFLDRRPAYPGISFARYERFIDIMADDNAADPSGFEGQYGLPRFKDHGGPWGGMQPYGWENFGDLPWAEGYSSLHYDWVGSMLLGFLRTGDYRLFDQARDMAVYRRDYGQNHATDTNEIWRGCSFYEKGFWHGNYRFGEQSHNWLFGLAMYYVLTGDEAAYEAAQQNVAFTLRYPPGQWSGWWGSRIPGWAIDNLLDAHHLLGYPGALAAAGAGVARFEQLEIADGSHGYHIDPGETPPSTSPWMDNIFFNAAARYVLTSGDTSHNAFLHRMKTWFRNDCLVQATGTVQAAHLPHVWYTWAPGQPVTPSLALCWPMMESLSWSSILFNDYSDLHEAGVLFEALTRYWQESPLGPTVNILDPGSFSPITMRPLSYPTTETKVLGIMLLWGHVHMVARAYFEGWL